MNDQIKVSIASDHAGFDLKAEIIKYLKDNEIDVIDRGPNKKEPVDYPDFASKVTQDIINQSGLNVIAADNLSDAAKKIVTAVKGK